MVTREELRSLGLGRVSGPMCWRQREDVLMERLVGLLRGVGHSGGLRDCDVMSIKQMANM